MSWVIPDPVTVELICLSDQNCPRHGDRVIVPLRPVAPGVLACPNFICADCRMELARVTDKEDHSGGPR